MSLFDNERDAYALWVDFWMRQGNVLTSFHRTPQENRDEGGDADSQHLVGLGSDWSLRQDTRALVTDARRRNYTVVLEDDHVHVQRFAAGFLASCGVVFPT